MICADEHGAYAGLAADHAHEAVIMATFAAGTVGKRLHYREPSADNGLQGGVRS